VEVDAGGDVQIITMDATANDGMGVPAEVVVVAEAGPSPAAPAIDIGRDA
jgi:hypothetical protein